MQLLADIVLATMNGIVWGLAIALVALGLVLTFGFLRLLNMAHGAFYALGAVTGFFLVERSSSFSLAMLAVPLLIGGAGLAVERTLLRPVRGIPNSEVLITFALAMVIEYSLLLAFGGAPRRLPYPVPGSVELLGETYPVYRLVVGLVALGLLLACIGLIERTRVGLQIQAANQDGDLAAALGIPVVRLTLLTFGGGTAFAALAGLMMAPIVAVEFRMGSDIIAISFLVTILGGMTKIWRVTLISLAAGVVENIGALWFDPRLTRAIVLLSLLAALLVIHGLTRRLRHV